jgi:hypothetical protein
MYARVPLLKYSYIYYERVVIIILRITIILCIASSNNKYIYIFT